MFWNRRNQYKVVRPWKDGAYYVLVRQGWFSPWHYVAVVDTRAEAKLCTQFHKRMRKNYKGQE